MEHPVGGGRGEDEGGGGLGIVLRLATEAIVRGDGDVDGLRKAGDGAGVEQDGGRRRDGGAGAGTGPPALGGVSWLTPSMREKK